MTPRDNLPGRKSFTPERRCHWFDGNGRPFKRLDGGLGCPRGPKCYFAHPTDLEEWRNARPGGDPPLHYLTDDEYRLITGHHRTPPRGFHPGPRLRSVSPGRRRSPPRRPSREPPSLASRIRGRSASREREMRRFMPRNSRSRSPGRGRVVHRTPPPLPRGPRMSTGGPPPDGPRGPAGTPRDPMFLPKAEDVAMRDVSRSAYAREDSVASSHHAVQQFAPSRPPPASSSLPDAKSAPTAAQAPPPVNATAASATTQAPDAIKLLESSTLQWQQISSAVAAASSLTAPRPRTTPPNDPSGEITAEDKVRIWSNRIELLAAATRTHNDCRSMENDVRDYKQLVESFSYQALPAEDRTVIEGHLQTIQSQLAEKSNDLKKLLTQLANAKFWTTYSDKSKASSPYDSGQEIAKQVQGLRASVSQLQSLFQTVGTRWEQAAKSLQSNRLSNIGSHSMDLSGTSLGGVGQSNVLIAEAIMPKELDKIRNAIHSFEERLRILESAAAQSGESVLENIDAIVAENVQALMLAATGTVQAAPPAPRPANPLTAQQLKMLESLQQSAAVASGQVQQLSQQVAEMRAANDQLQGENQQLQAENARLRQQLEESMAVQLPGGTDTAKLDQMQSEMRALNAAVVAFFAQQRPPASASGSSADALVEQIVPKIITSLPKAIVPELQSFREQVQEMLRSQQTEFVQALSSNMAYAREAVEMMRSLKDKTSTPENADPAPGSPFGGANGVKSEVPLAEP